MCEISWKIARVPDVKDEGEKISQNTFLCGEQWINAAVPGTVLYSYEKAGKIADPYFSDNILKLDQDYYNTDYWYRGEAEIPESYGGKYIWLNFGGVNHKADIFANGKKLGSINGAFRRGTFNITKIAQPGKTLTVAVYVHWCDSGLLDTPTFIGSAGWDFMPAIPGRNMGLYRPVTVGATGSLVIRDPFVTSDLVLPDMKKATVNISAEIENVSDKDEECILHGRLHPADKDFSVSVVIPAHSSKAVKLNPITVFNPEVWWPAGYGGQPLYCAELETFDDSGNLSSSENVVFGIRKLEYDRDGHDLELSINGVRVLCKGGNWGMPDAMLKHSDRFIYDSIRLHKEAGINMIRTWHGTSDFDVFYDACDKYGIMVFEDFALHGKQLPLEPQLFMESARDKLRRLRNRCCIVLWCGENEAVPPAPLDVQLPEAVEELDGTRLYIAASNCDGVHGGTTYTIQDPAWFFGHAEGFITEIGTQTIPNVESMRRMMKKEELWPAGNPVWEHHDYNFGIGNKNSKKYTDEITARYGSPDNIEDFCRKAQLVNVETYKAIFESFNDGMFDRCSGLLLWMSAPAWPSLIWEIYDYYLDCFGSYYGTKKATEMLHVQWNARTGSVKAVNHTAADFSGTVTAEVYNMDGELKFAREASADVRGGSAVEVMKIFADTAVNIAAGKKGTASACENKRDIPNNAFDGNDITRWTCDGSPEGWLCVDLEGVYAIDGVRISWENAYAADFHIDVSADGETWKTVAETVSGNGGLNTLMFEECEARYVKLICTRRGTMWNYSCYQFMVLAAGTSSKDADGLSKVHFIKLLMKDNQGKPISDNFYWRSKFNCDCKELARLDLAQIKAAAAARRDGETVCCKIDLENSGNSVAACVRIKAARSDAAAGEDDRILPAFFSDNYVWLLPGEKRRIELKYAADVYGAVPELEISGLNVPACRITAEGFR